jgi:putative SOS response-associated peptidase YedK
MCGRFVQVINIRKIENTYGIRLPEDTGLDGSYNVAAGDYAYVLSSSSPGSLSRYRFGLTPSWAKKQMYLINARAEGDANKENDPDFRGKKGIIMKPSFRKPVRSQRCIIIANAFIEGPAKEKLNKPYVIARRDKNYLSLAGLWDTWVNKETGEEINSFAIITTVANKITRMIGHPRSPVIIPEGYEKRWLDPELPLVDVLKFLKPYPGELLEAYPLSVKIKDPKNKTRDVLVPVGDVIRTNDDDIIIEKDLKLQGMGNRKKKG